MFLICGEALYDVFLESETPRGLRMDACLGGSPFNVAVGLARLSRRAGLLTGLSTDSLGHHLEKVLTDEGVETAFLARKDGPTTLAFVGVDSDGLTKYTFYGHGAGLAFGYPGALQGRLQYARPFDGSVTASDGDKDRWWFELTYQF